MITITQAHEQDIETIQNLNHEVMIDNQKYDPDLNTSWTKSELGKTYFAGVLSDTTSAVFVAKDGEKSVGYISLSPKSFSYRTKKYIEVNDMGVIPEYRSQGIGAQLMEHGLNWAKEQGFTKAYVSCYSENAKALAFYEKSKFGKIDVSLEREI